MKRFTCTWLTGLVVAVCFSQAALAQETHYDWTTTTEYRTTVDPLQLTPAQRADLEAIVRAQGADSEPIFIRERADLRTILTPKQQVLYDSMVAPRYYYHYAVMTPAEWVGYRQNMQTRLNLTPEQQIRYAEVIGRSDTELKPIVTRYESRYTRVLTPAQWVAYRGRTSSYISSSRSAGSASSVQSEEYRRTYRETTVETTPGWKTTTPSAQVKTTTQTRAATWRDHDLK